MPFQTRRGNAIRHGDSVLVPVARSWSPRRPGRIGALVWNRPVGIEIERSGEIQFLPVPDYTRRLQLLALGIGAAAFVLARFFRRRKRGGLFRKLLFGR
jgi:hypothetical protein